LEKDALAPLKLGAECPRWHPLYPAQQTPKFRKFPPGSREEPSGEKVPPTGWVNDERLLNLGFFSAAAITPAW